MNLTRSAVCLALLLSPALAAAEEPTFDRGRTIRLMRELHRFEKRMIAATAVAEERAESASLRALADRMLDDHKKVDDRVLAWAEHHRLPIADDEQVALRAPQNDRDVDQWFRDLARSENEQWIGTLRLMAKRTSYKPLELFLVDIAKQLEHHQRQLEQPVELASKGR